MIRRWSQGGDPKSASEIVMGYRRHGRENRESFRRLREYYDSTRRASQVLEDFASKDDFWREMGYAAEDMAAANPTQFAAMTGYYTDEPALRITMDTPVRLAFAARYPMEYTIPNMNPTITFRDFERELMAGRYPFDLMPTNPKLDRGVTDTINRDRAYSMWAEAKGITEKELDEFWEEYYIDPDEPPKPKKTQKPAKGKTKTASSQRKPARKPQAKVSTASRSPKGTETKRRRR